MTHQQQLRTLLAQCMSYYHRGDYEKTQTICQKALALHPNHGDLLHILGVCQLHQQHYDQAIDCISRAITADSHHAQYYVSLALAHYYQGKPDVAINHCHQAIEQDPNYQDAYNKLGFIYRGQENHQQAKKALEKSLQLDPDNPETLNLYGLTRYDLHKTRDSLDYLYQAITIKPDFAECLDNIGIIEQNFGNIDLAREYFLRAVTVKPTYCIAYLHLAESKRHQHLSDPYTKTLEKMLMNQTLSTAEQVNCYFALGKIYDDCQHYNRAFGFYRKANQLSGIQYHCRPLWHLIASIKKNFNKDFFIQHQQHGLENTRPVFIVGMPRSGTSLVEQILASHSSVYGAGELLMVGHIADQIRCKQPTQPLETSISQLSAEDIQHYAHLYISYIHKCNANAAIVIDKMPMNFQYLGLISLLFPKAKIIYCQRHPLDLCLSCYFHHFKTKIPFTYDLKTLGEYYRCYQALMDHWLTVLPNPIHQVNYEKLVVDPKAEMTALVNFCDLTWEDKLLSFDQTQRHVSTASNWQVRQPLYHHSLGRYQHYLSHLQPLQQALANNDDSN